MRSKALEVGCFTIAMIIMLGIAIGGMYAQYQMNKKKQRPTEVQIRIHEGIMDHYDRQEFDPVGTALRELEQKRKE